MKDAAALLINCPDRKGIVATVAEFLYKHNANILHAEAQNYFVSKGGSATNNVDRLDADHDGIACESLP